MKHMIRLNLIIDVDACRDDGRPESIYPEVILDRIKAKLLGHTVKDQGCTVQVEKITLERSVVL